MNLLNYFSEDLLSAGSALHRFDPASTRFVFVHVPKCGGTSLHVFLEKCLRGRYHHFCPAQTPPSLDDLWGAGGHQYNSQNPLFAHNPDKKFDRLIVLRDPVSRFISFYKHIQDHPQHNISRRKGVLDLSLHDFALYCRDNDINEFDNLSAKFIMGDRPIGSAGKVLKILEGEFKFIVPLWGLDLFYPVLAYYFNSPRIKTKAKAFNVSKERVLAASDCQAAAKIVLESNEIDAALYEYAIKAFHRQFSSWLIAAGSEFQAYADISTELTALKDRQVAAKQGLQRLRQLCQA